MEIEILGTNVLFVRGRGIVAACFSACLLMNSGPAFAWGAEGHRIIAHLAFERLTPKAKAAVKVLVAQSVAQGTPSCPVADLDDAATWPDCVRRLHGRFNYLGPMHFEDVPLCGTVPKATYCPDAKCITDETQKAIGILRDHGAPALQRLQALEEVSHFVGDIHQPLHAADNGDRGGNEVHVLIGRRHTNLHHIWDDEVLENAVGRSETEAENLVRPVILKNAFRWVAGTPDTWLAETHRLASDYVYPKLASPPACGRPAPDQTITQNYLDGAVPLVRIQLARAAVRLAEVLNRSLN